MAETLCSGNVTTKLQRIAELAREDRSRVFTSVAHAIDLEWVKEACRRTRKDGAAGVDGCPPSAERDTRLVYPRMS
jgi:hypothetical protein